MKKEHIIFDLDGTLIDSRQEMISTYKKVFAQIPPVNSLNAEELDFGAPLPVILESAYGKNDELIAKARAIFVEHYDNSTYEQTDLYPTVFETLEQLHKDGIVLHIATNKRMTPTVNILKAKQVFSLFTSVKTSDLNAEKLVTKREMVSAICSEFEIEKGMMVGDSRQDIEAGHSCGLVTIAVLYGYEKKADLLEKKPKFAIDELTQILNILSTETYEKTK